MGSGNYNLPVTVPVAGTYAETSMLQTSPSLTHQLSPRPSSSETDSGKFQRLDLLLMCRESYKKSNFLIRTLYSVSIGCHVRNVEWISTLCITDGRISKSRPQSRIRCASYQ